jgi:pyruvate/2-oxoglutarate dehydrogenase complex dihydrolipoamide acyltransferase (E2) component
MAEVILMPRLSDTMTEGVIAAWHKKVGDPVKKGELLAEIETDKATMELESYKDGTLLHIGAGKGGKIQVNDLLAIIGQPAKTFPHTFPEEPPMAAAQPDMQNRKPKQQDTRRTKGKANLLQAAAATAAADSACRHQQNGRSGADAAPERYHDRRRDCRVAQKSRRCREKRRPAGRY